MKITIAAIGRLKKGPEFDLFDRYFQRSKSSGRAIGISPIEVREFNESSIQNIETRKKAEAAQLLTVVSPHSLFIAMDESGKNLSSIEFSNTLRNLRDGGETHIVIAVGGPDGIDESLMNKAHTTLMLGKMTWPHQLARILLMEQIYRAITLISGHPYHRQ